MCVYKENDNWIRTSISSILNQTFRDFEFIIVNDNPKREISDSILSHFEKYDSRIVLINNKENLGLTKSLNIALKVAKGKYIARMDADDISLPQRLLTQFKFMESNQEIVACGSFIRVFGRINKIDKSLPKTTLMFKNVILIRNPLPHPTAFIRRETIERNEIKYDENFLYAQDYRLWTNLLKYGSLVNIPQVLLYYRVADNQISIKNKNEQIRSAQTIRLDYLKSELKLMNIEYFDHSLRDLAQVIYQTQVNSIYKSYILLLVFLSLDRYSLSDLLLFFYRVNINVVISNYKSIIRRLLFPKRYPALL